MRFQTKSRAGRDWRTRLRRTLPRYGLLLVLVNLIGAALPAQAEPLRVLVLGDSLTAGYGLAGEQSFPAQLERALRGRGRDAVVINAGVSGDTSAGGLARLDWVLAEAKPHAAIVELGANDGLRGLDPVQTEANLAGIIERLQHDGVPILLAGMRAPPNFGRDYQAAYERAFARLKDRFDVLFYPFFLEGVAAEPALNQADGIHPNARGVQVVVERILPYVERLLAARG